MEIRYARPYFESFAIALFLTLLPFKPLAYVTPFFVLFWFIVRAASGKTLMRTIIGLLLFVLVASLYYFLYQSYQIDFLLSSTFVSMLTHGTIILVVLLPGGQIISQPYKEKYMNILKYVILIEGLIGIFQFLIVELTGKFDILSGDAVQGTIGIDAFLIERAGFGNQMFVINMVFFLLLFIPHVLVKRRHYFVVAVGVLSIMLAGVLHVFIGLLWAVVLTILFYRRNIFFSDIHKLVIFVAIAVVLILPLEFFFPGITDTARIFIAIYEDKDSPKFVAIDKALYQLPREYPLVYAIGLGPGQYSSRAGLMSTGEYYGTLSPFLPNAFSKPLQQYFRPTWYSYLHNPNRYGNSTMHRPYFTLLSVFTEFGLAGILVFAAVIIYLFVRLRRLALFYKPRSAISYYWAFSLGVLVVTVAGISFFENYIETTQAILPGFMLFKAFYSGLKEEVEAYRTADEAASETQEQWSVAV